MQIEVLFYHYDTVKCFLSPWSRFRLWFQSKVTRYVHCNVSANGKIYELASWGGSLYALGEYPFPSSLSIPVETTEKDFYEFVRTFRKASLRRWPFLCHVLALALPQLDNCASVTRAMVGERTTTPDRLLKVLSGRGNGKQAD